MNGKRHPRTSISYLSSGQIESAYRFAIGKPFELITSSNLICNGESISECHSRAMQAWNDRMSLKLAKCIGKKVRNIAFRRRRVLLLVLSNHNVVPPSMVSIKSQKAQVQKAFKRTNKTIETLFYLGNITTYVYTIFGCQLRAHEYII